MGYSRKKQTGDLGHGISWSIEEIASGYCRGQLKKKWNFQGCSRKTHVEFPWDLVFDLETCKGCHKILQKFWGSKLFSRISRGKVTNLKLQGFFNRKVYPQRHYSDFFRNNSILKYDIDHIKTTLNLNRKNYH